MHEVLKKKFGQNFLIDKNILIKISNLIKKKNLRILEIGPGDGRLTEYIINHHPKELFLIEIDKDLIGLLNKKFSDFQNVKIINQDILKFEILDTYDLVISNLPYNISSQILVKICKLKTLPKNLILMFQKEFSDRLLDKKLNSLNSLVNCFYYVKKNFDISKNCFKPKPKINSTVLSFTRKDNLSLNFDEIEKFIEFKRKLFSHKRKTLKNILKNYINLVSNFDLSVRAENLSLEKLIALFKKINP